MPRLLAMDISSNRHHPRGHLRVPRPLQIGAMLLIIAYAIWAAGSGGLAAAQSTGPQVALTGPVANGVYIAPASIALSATAQGNFAQVDFYANATKVGTSRTLTSSTAYAATWSGAAAGTYALTAVAVKVNGAQVPSAAVQVVVKNARDFPLVQKTSFKHQGAFRVPRGVFGGSTFGYSGPIGYNPVRNSLFMVGHVWQQFVGEISIPQVRSVATIAEHAVAEVLQGFADPADGKAKQVNPRDTNQILVGGLLSYKNRLVFTEYSSYDGNGTQWHSHFTSTMDMSNKTDAQGPFHVNAPKAGLVSGYLGQIPAVWQSVLGGTALTGQCCIAIVSRTSLGPAAFSFDPGDVGVVTPIPASPLVYYPEAHPTLGEWGATSPTFNGSTKIAGVVFPEGTRSVLFFGRHGIGPFCYGTGATCKDPVISYQGTHAYPYIYQVWAYDAADLLDVKNGVKQPWTVRPYAVWQMDFPTPSWTTYINGAAYDPATGRIFISQGFADGELPMVHVYTLDLR